MAVRRQFPFNLAIERTKFCEFDFRRGTVSPRRPGWFSRFCDCCSGVFGRARHCAQHNISMLFLLRSLLFHPDIVAWASLVQSLLMHHHSEHFLRAWIRSRVCFVLFCCASRQWRRGVCRSNYDTTSTRLSVTGNYRETALSSPHRKSEKNLLPTVATRSRKVARPLSKPSDLHTNKEAQAE